jgi:hypothetical protein
MDKITIYILTHKKFDYSTIEEKQLYKPLLCGSACLNEDFGYICDDIGDNISNLNKYYAELTGEYWAWKNDSSDIIGFCHYRRYFLNGIFNNVLSEKNLRKSLENHDIILPQKRYLNKTNIEEIKEGHFFNGVPQKEEDYDILREIIKIESPDYLESFDNVLNENTVYWYNMFICRKELADEYFQWMFNILEIFCNQIDFSQYGDNKRILGYLSERLLNVFVKKHDLKIDEKYVVQTNIKIPFFNIIDNKFPVVQKFVKFLVKLKRKIKRCL